MSSDAAPLQGVEDNERGGQRERERERGSESERAARECPSADRFKAFRAATAARDGSVDEGEWREKGRVRQRRGWRRLRVNVCVASSAEAAATRTRVTHLRLDTTNCGGMQCETLLRALAQRNCLVPIYSCRQRDSLVSVRLVPPPPRLMTTASSAESMSTRCSASVLFPPPSSKTALFTTAPTAAGAECDKRSGLHMAKSVLGTICNRALSTSSLWRGAEPPPPAPSSTLSAPPTASPSASHTAPPTAPSAKDERALQMVGVHFNYGLPQFTVPLPARYSMMTSELYPNGAADDYLK